ncbi:MAG: transcriptional regulator NrdR [candidate division WOR-3 bacterium]
MKCPYCSGEEDKVLDSRPVQEGNAIRRRRECLKCGKRFTTYEYVERMPLMVIKRDGRHEPYDRQKVVNGIVLACRKRPVGRNEIERIVDALERRLEEEGRVEVTSAEIGELVLEQLIEIDPVAYVRFASVYRQFTSPEQFVEELKKIKKEARGVRGG